ncbi:hypothetical protein A2U01_0028109, partial [Trifolium medium]|nr:hypothetical protein [Trifolium medium]
IREDEGRHGGGGVFKVDVSENDGRGGGVDEARALGGVEEVKDKDGCVLIGEVKGFLGSQIATVGMTAFVCHFGKLN